MVETTCTVPAAGFIGEPSIEIPPGTTVEVETVVPIGDSIIPYVWVRDDDSEAVRRCLEAHRLIEHVERVASVDGRVLLRLVWGTELHGAVQCVTAAEGTILHAEGDDRSWEFSARFPSWQALSRFREHCVDAGIALNVREIRSELAPDHDLFDDLTPEQLEALRVAGEMGYYDVPRRASLREVGTRLDVSDQAASERLRRAVRTLIEGLGEPAD